MSYTKKIALCFSVSELLPTDLAGTISRYCTEYLDETLKQCV